MYVLPEQRLHACMFSPAHWFVQFRARLLPNYLQSMSTSERFVRAFLTIRAAFGSARAWDMWARLATQQGEPIIAGSGATRDEAEAALRTVFESAWEASGALATTNKGRAAGKKPRAKVPVPDGATAFCDSARKHAHSHACTHTHTHPRLLGPFCVLPDVTLAALCCAGSECLPVTFVSLVCPVHRARLLLATAARCCDCPAALP
jgi:hypothetical protein